MYLLSSSFMKKNSTLQTYYLADQLVKKYLYKLLDRLIATYFLVEYTTCFGLTGPSSGVSYEGGLIVCKDYNAT
jgi:hypothetical protein